MIKSKNMVKVHIENGLILRFLLLLSFLVRARMFYNTHFGDYHNMHVSLKTLFKNPVEKNGS